MQNARQGAKSLAGWPILSARQQSDWPGSSEVSSRSFNNEMTLEKCPPPTRTHGGRGGLAAPRGFACDPLRASRPEHKSTPDQEREIVKTCNGV